MLDIYNCNSHFNLIM